MSWIEENAWEQAYDEWEENHLLHNKKWKNGS